MSTIKTVSIKFKAGAYGVFRNLQNKVWYAIAEYVDNAVQSYEDNKARFEKMHGRRYQFRVDITINREKDFMIVKDNAGGINEKHFHRAFEPANIPTDNTGLHEFGMGMKTASIWLSEIWSVRTVAVGEGVERFVEFDLKKVLSEEKEELKVYTQKASATQHGTEITLKGLTKNAPTAFQMSKLKSHLASIYRKYLRTGEMILAINGDPLQYNDPEILLAPPYNNLSGKKILWRKDINFKLGEYKAKGFIALLSELSTNEHNGLSLFRRGRVIEGSHDEKYRPKVLCGQVGSPRYKRLFGELELDGFDVSFNKGSFQDTADIEAFMEALKIELTEKNFNLLRQADEFRKVKKKTDVKKVAKSLVKSFSKENDEKPMTDKVNNSLKELEDKKRGKADSSKRSPVIDKHEDQFKIKDVEYSLKMELINSSSNELYTLELIEDGPGKKQAKYKINLNHPFFNSFDQFRKKEDYKPIIMIIRSLVMAEIYSPSQGTKNAGNIRMNFNTFLRNL